MTHSSEAVLTHKEFLLFRDLFYDKIGIHLPDHKLVLVSTRLWKRLKACNIENYLDYYQLINQKGQESELGRALESITTNETYFFREPGHFDYLKSTILPELKSEKNIRIWSAACSSGEEIYSIAMLLADQRISPWELLGSDINQSMLEKARRAIYLDQRTENIPDHLRRRYCRKGVGPYLGSLRIDPDLRSRIKLQCIELHKSLPDIGMFDVVFLRNVMIYFDDHVRSGVIERIVAHIKPGGYLFVGHSESLRGLQFPVQQVHPAIYRLKPS